MNTRRDEITGYHRISVSIWSDPEFTAMTPESQLVYFMARCRNGRQRFTHARAAEMGGSFSEEQFSEACARLRQTAYARVLDGRARRDIPNAIRREVMNRDKSCQQCGAVTDLTLDHIVPYSKGGPDTVLNLQVLCRSCNARKGTN